MPPQDYVLTSAAFPTLLGTLGITTQNSYIGAHVLIALAAIAAPFLTNRSLYFANMSRLLFVMLAGGPVLALLLLGIGGYYAITIIAMSVAVLTRNSWLSYVAWVVVGVNHSALGLISLVIWAAVLLARDGNAPSASRLQQIRQVALSLASLVLGAALVAIVTAAAWGDITSRWEVFRQYEPSHYITMFIGGMPFLAFSALGVGWLVLFDPSVRKRLISRILVISALLVTMTLPLVAVDQTRVVAIVLYPSVLLWTLRIADSSEQRVLNRLWRRWSMPAAVIPVVIILLGSPEIGSWENFLNWRASLS